MQFLLRVLWNKIFFISKLVIRILPSFHINMYIGFKKAAWEAIHLYKHVGTDS